MRTSATAPRSASRSGSSWRSSGRGAPRARQPAGLGARRRYAAAARLALPRGATIVTGHTADDQVETILYRLASSPSRRALLGMRPLDGRLARPLLGITRAEMTAYCEQRGLRWREDTTNAEPAYARNRIRARPAAGARQGPPGGGAPTCCAPPSCCATRPRCSTPSSPPSSTAPASAARHDLAPAPGRAAPGAAPPRRPAARRRAPPAGRSPGAARHAEQVAALRRTGIAMLDLGGGVRAVAERGVLRAETLAAERLGYI